MFFCRIEYKFGKWAYFAIFKSMYVVLEVYKESFGYKTCFRHQKLFSLTEIMKKCYKIIIFCWIELKFGKRMYLAIFKSMYVVLEVYKE